MIAISALSKNRIIGNKGKLPWKSPEDLGFFKEITWDKNLLMGRPTFESLPKKLENRFIYVLTRKIPHGPGRTLVEIFNGEVILGAEHHTDEGFSYITDINYAPKDCVVCGGAQIYKMTLSLCHTLYLTEFNFEVEGDTVFPFAQEEIDDMFPEKKLVKEIKNGKIFEYSK